LHGVNTTYILYIQVHARSSAIAEIARVTITSVIAVDWLTLTVILPAICSYKKISVPLSSTIFELYDVEELVIEIEKSRLYGHSRLLKMLPFDTPHAIFY